MKYGKLVEIYEELVDTTKRLEKNEILARFLKDVLADDLPSIMLLLQGKVFHSYDSRKIGFAAQYAVKAIQTATGASSTDVMAHWKKSGDLGETAANFTGKKTQMTLGSQPLTTQRVLKNLQKLSTIEGNGSTDMKIKLVAELLSSSSPLEAKYIVRTVLEDLRVGAKGGVLRDGIVWAYYPRLLFAGKSLETKIEVDTKDERVLRVDTIMKLSRADLKNFDYVEGPDEKTARAMYNWIVDQVRHALDLTNDFGVVAQKSKTKGVKGIIDIGLIPGNPVKVMLYPKAKDFEDAFKTVGKPAIFEPKFDGFRLQIHRNGSEIKLFTRRLDEVTIQFPDVVEVIKKQVKSHDFILDAEIVGMDPVTKKHISFQNISQRIKRKHGIAEMVQKLPVMINAFDIMELNGHNLLSVPFTARREKLEAVIKFAEHKIAAAPQIMTDDVSRVQVFYEKALSDGFEGVMGKSLDGPYKPGSRVGYGVKIKPVMESLDCVVVGAEWGEGKRSAWLSSYDIAVWDGDSLVGIGKVSTGLKEKSEEGLSFFEMTTALQPLITVEKDKHVDVSPQVVLEVSYEEIQNSPSNTSGFALRFPRILRRRDMEKGVEDADTLKRVKQLFFQQKK